MFIGAAGLVIALSSIFVATVPDATKSDKKTIVVSQALNVDGYESFDFDKDNAIFDISFYSAPMRNFFGLSYGLSGTYTNQWTKVIGAGLGKVIDLGDKFDTGFFIFPSYSKIKGDDKDSISGNFNFKTELNVNYKLNDKIKFGIGVMHISNAGIEDPNDGIDAIKFNIGYSF